MRGVPGVWLPVGLYRARTTAVTIAESICTGHRLRSYLPAGSFEARTEQVGDETGVTARYVGGKP
jgi:hypothetical protein